MVRSQSWPIAQRCCLCSHHAHSDQALQCLRGKSDPLPELDACLACRLAPSPSLSVTDCRSAAAAPAARSAPAARPAAPRAAPAARSAAGDSRQAEVDELTTQVQTMQLTLEDLEKERDFYFGKLRDIEVICQEEEGTNSDLIQRILAILYATAKRTWH
ncbi:microtubule-associated protein RP/EB family member 1-like isoform X2 [Amphibalanus amphitrite]|uniref:microtubule-associated protein RP/EB family member 1-like isoform X2 n=1 Tax=Amphibalanus amphitrite TaxID=1232801 RepID=UPI001C90F08D|nr:microtubule-associated protein RP/EB family member 1-like isoform X2 [Amphibalanus amphitrite]